MTLAAPGRLSFKIIHSGAPVEKGFAIGVGNFTNAEGVVVPVSISTADGPDTGLKQIEVGAFTDNVLSVNLHVTAFPAPGNYTGQFITTIADPQAKPTIWRLVLASASELRPATLVLDQNAQTLNTVLPSGLDAALVSVLPRWMTGWIDDKGAATVTVHARDKTGNWPLTGLIARFETGLKTPDQGLNPCSELLVAFNGRTVRDFFASPSTSGDSCPSKELQPSGSQGAIGSEKQSRTIGPGEQATMMLTFRPSQPGEYVIPLRIAAANSAADELQKLTVTIQARRTVAYAVFVLLFAVFVSAIATRVINTLRQRAALLDKLQTLQPAWLADEQPVLPVTWLRATLNQTKKLSERRWLTGSTEIDARVNLAAAVFAALIQMRGVRDRIEMISEPMIRKRAEWKLTAAVKRLSATSLADHDLADFKAQLAEFDDWIGTDDVKRKAAYWEDLLRSINRVRAQAKIIDLKEYKDAAKRLVDELTKLEKVHSEGSQPQDQPPSATLETDAEDKYQRLALLLDFYEHAKNPSASAPLNDDLRHFFEHAPLANVRSFVDAAWWKLLKTTELEIDGPSSTLDPPQAFELVTFRINTPRDPFLINTYLMSEKLTYKWTIVVKGKRILWLYRRTLGLLEPTSSQPYIAQYAPNEGTMRASVKISYDGELRDGEVSSKYVTVAGSSDFGVLAKYELAGFLALLLAAVTSLVSGITLYALKPTFGSFLDYLTLFTWGASIDQGKNFLQSLGTYMPTPGKATSDAGAK